MRRPLLSLLAVLLLSWTASADVVVTRDGRRIEGTIVSESPSEVRVRTRFGEIVIARADVVSIERGKSKRQEFEERWSEAESAESADDFHALGLWAQQRNMRGEARRAMARALELDSDHAGANTWLGRVKHRGEWMTPEERDRRMAEERDAEMRSRGLVPYGDGWVTPEERAKLEQGLVQHEGRWMPFAEAQRAKGLGEWMGAWVPMPEAMARHAAASVEELAEARFEVAIGGDQVLVAGPLAREGLERVAERCVAGREWFDERYALEPGLDLFDGRLAELYLFDADAHYLATIEHFASLTHTLPEGWAAAVRTTHGFLYWDPFPLSSARRDRREALDLEGHCYHHFGHLLVNRLGYDGRLLPPWYDEALAGLFEHALHGRNAVFCRSSASTGLGTAARGTAFSFDPRELREGSWRDVLSRALAEGHVQPFDRLARKHFGDLELLDVAVGMGILDWLSGTAPGALAAFHAELRRTAPAAPMRVIDSSRERQERYDAAFRAASGLSWREADQAWRAWARSR